MQTMMLTENNTGLQLNIAVNYGGRWDITQACKKIAEKIESGKLCSDQIDAQMFNEHVCLSELPEPDLFIRTGGEQRISNFLIWQMAYTELYFSDLLWPDFDRQAFNDALVWFAGRQRRFGKTGEQIEQSGHG